MLHAPASLRPRVGVSACLLGQSVRYDGGHKRHPVVTEHFAALFELLPVCPEVELGLGVPRPTLSLRASGVGAGPAGASAESPEGAARIASASVRLVVVESGVDRTEAMEAYAQARLSQLEGAGGGEGGGLCGFVLKARSPSCALESAELLGADGRVLAGDGRGLFAAALVARWPRLPVIEEAALEDADELELFLDGVFTVARAQQAARRGG